MSSRWAGPSPWPRLVAGLMSGPRRSATLDFASPIELFVTRMYELFMQRANDIHLAALNFTFASRKASSYPIGDSPQRGPIVVTLLL